MKLEELLEKEEIQKLSIRKSEPYNNGSTICYNIGYYTILENPKTGEITSIFRHDPSGKRHFDSIEEMYNHVIGHKVGKFTANPASWRD